MHTMPRTCATQVDAKAVLCTCGTTEVVVMFITSTTHIADHDENKYAEYAVSLL